MGSTTSSHVRPVGFMSARSGRMKERPVAPEQSEFGRRGPAVAPEQ